MKTFFNSREIAHVWAHKLAPIGRSPSAKSFDGDAFLSYATVIARRIEYKGRTAYVVDVAGFSPTTSHHQTKVRCAIPDTEKVFLINNGERGQDLRFTPQALRDHYVKASEEVEARTPSRLARLRASQYLEATAELRKALGVCEFFGLGTLSLSRKIEKREALNSQAADIIAQAEKSRQAAKAKREAKEAKERLARNIAFAEAYLTDPDAKPIWDAETRRIPEGFPPALLGKFLARVCDVNAKAIEAWRAGQNINLPHDFPVMLRAEHNAGQIPEGADAPEIIREMVTSKGARVPLADAERAFKFVMKCRAKGWHRNGETFELGGYHLDAVNAQGVVAGCHRVSWEEIERFAKSQGWTA